MHCPSEMCVHRWPIQNIAFTKNFSRRFSLLPHNQILGTPHIFRRYVPRRLYDQRTRNRTIRAWCSMFNIFTRSTFIFRKCRKDEKAGSLACSNSFVVFIRTREFSTRMWLSEMVDLASLNARLQSKGSRNSKTSRVTRKSSRKNSRGVGFAERLLEVEGRSIIGRNR